MTKQENKNNHTLKVFMKNFNFKDAVSEHIHFRLVGSECNFFLFEVSSNFNSFRGSCIRFQDAF